jgi:hypothetical protein
VESGRYDKLTKLMTLVAGGDRYAAFTLRLDFDRELKNAVRRAATEVGRTLPSDEVEAVATDFCTWLVTHAGAWRPEGGALPWRWAWGYLKALVRENQGFWPLTIAEPVEREMPEALVAVMDDQDLLDTVARLAAVDERVADLLYVLGAASAAPRDIALLLDLAEQSVAGDPSPSHTIAPRYGLSPDAVRKRAQRTRDKVHGYIAEHPEFAELAELPLLAKRERPKRRKDEAA